MLPSLRNDLMQDPFATSPINRMESFFANVFGDGAPMGRAWSEAPVAMWEDDDRIYVEAELPGVTDKDVDITVQKDVLFIRGDRRPEEGRRYLYNGRTYGRFERVITLPEAVDADGVEAALHDGVLRIELPRSPQARPRKITLKSS